MSDQLSLLEQDHAAAVQILEQHPSLFAKLRDYQKQCLEEVKRRITEVRRVKGTVGANIMICAPTGAGKTLIASYIIWETARHLKHAGFVVDRVNLIDQTSEVFDAIGIPHGVHQADHWRKRPYERVQLCSAQTLSRRPWPETDVLVIDEAHTLYDVVKKRIAKRDCLVLGLSATPFTKGLGKHFDALVNVTTTNRLIQEGFLAPYRIFAASQPDMTGVAVTSLGEWEDAETSKRAMTIVGDCVAEYQKHGVTPERQKKFICRGVDVDHVQELHRQFMAAGILCATYTYRDSDDLRKEIVKEFRKPDSFYRGLITVSAATKGFDVPDIECVIDARPLRKSLAEVIQFFGRGLRIADGKSQCLILDHSGNTERFWNEIQTFYEQGCLHLDDGKKREAKGKKDLDAKPPMNCPVCHHIHDPMPFCPACGHEYPRRNRAVQHAPGSLQEILATGNSRQIAAQLWPQVCHYARRVTKNLHLPEQAKKAEKLALATYRNLTNEWPKDQYFSSTIPVEPSKEILGQIKRHHYAYAKKTGKRYQSLEPVP